MGRYVLRRLLQIVPVFLGTTFLIYFLMFAVPGDPLDNLAGGRQENPAYLEYLTSQFNLDDPFFVQYAKYLMGIFTGDLGTTFSGQAVTEIFAERWPVTVQLALTALGIEILIGVSLGVWAALRRGGVIDSLALGGTLVVISIPVFVLAYVAQWVIGVKLGWLPVSGIADGWPVSYLLPATVLALLSLAYVLRLTRQSLLETVNQDFFSTARAKGLPVRRIIREYGLRNSLIPVVTFLGADLAALMGGAVVVEGIFNVPGIGQQLYSSIRLGEAVVVVGTVTALVIAYLLMNLLVDVLYAVLDPRIRYD
ncbi:MAG: ABC transporter permease [Candidatus Nanopelagicales bacterium]|nr:ABC transporter permease [Candidatus Nanopelagicales bacterium]